MRQVGFNVQLASTDWGAVVTRRSNQNPPDQGGWNVFYTWSGGNATASPISLFAHAAIGKKAWFGWPENADIEKMRTEWAYAPNLEARKAVTQPHQQDHDGLCARCQDRSVGSASGLPRGPHSRLDGQVPEVIAMVERGALRLRL